MTRAERLAQQEAKAKAKLEAQRQQLAHVQAQRRQAEQKALAQRWLLVGRLVHDAGLFVLTDTTLHQLFAVLARLVDAPDPVATLAGLLCDAKGLSGTAVDGTAHAPHGVSTPC
jgi:hypothetical protein